MSTRKLSNLGGSCFQKTKEHAEVHWSERTLGNHCNKSFKCIQGLLSVIKCVQYAAYPASNQRLEPKLQHHYHAMGNLKTFLTFNLMQWFRAPAFVLLSQIHSVFCDLLGLATETLTQDLRAAVHVMPCDVSRNVSVKQKRATKPRCLHLLWDRIPVQPTLCKALGPQAPKRWLSTSTTWQKERKPFLGDFFKDHIED